MIQQSHYWACTLRNQNSKRLMHNMYNKLQLLKILRFRDFLGGPVVKTLSTNAGGAGSILGWGAEILHAL